MLWNPKLNPCKSYFIFKQISQWLNDFFKVYIFRQSPYIMVTFYNRCIAFTALNNIRINCALNKKINGAYFFCLVFKYFNKLSADNFSLGLWITYTFKCT